MSNTIQNFDRLQEKLKDLRFWNKERIQRLNDRIKEGYNNHGIIFTGDARRLNDQIEKIKKETLDLVKKRNLMKKEMKIAGTFPEPIRTSFKPRVMKRRR